MTKLEEGQIWKHKRTDEFVKIKLLSAINTSIVYEILGENRTHHSYQGTFVVEYEYFPHYNNPLWKAVNEST
jgi:hypothetical protein